MRVPDVRLEGAILVRCCILENSSRRLLHNAYEYVTQIDGKENGPLRKAEKGEAGENSVGFKPFSSSRGLPQIVIKTIFCFAFGFSQAASVAVIPELCDAVCQCCERS